jgi:hypothetical protein
VLARFLPTRPKLPQAFGQNPLEGGSAKHGLQVRRSATKPCGSRYGVGGVCDNSLASGHVDFTQVLSPTFVMLSPYLPFPICIRILAKEMPLKARPFSKPIAN